MLRPLLIAILIACATPALAEQSGPVTYQEDARSHASDAEIRVARRAYRAECQRHQSVDYCECMTGGMAQSLPPEDLRTATALQAHWLSGAQAPQGLNQSSIEAAETAAAQYEPLCHAQRR